MKKSWIPHIFYMKNLMRMININFEYVMIKFEPHAIQIKL
jgi:hypothetical protein